MMETIPILVSLPDKDEEVKGIFSLDAEVILRDIPTELLRDNLNKLCQGVATLLNDIKKVGGFRLKEVTIQVEVNAEGGVELIGTAKVGGKGAITLTFAE
ncbi:hypothetical protein [Nostoc sp. TCL240-02]|uniref:Pepco domain-containing protein n=1 Tax=Nostoc sp. TCL240-02 TaxID=2572090 RepID=UPI00157F85B3|nr:hypothetical protein [Nostoc sp. TCL240-02]QKQ74899.1 hypothetical protein FBB35_17585 [Nostoc sp. TCL240-02]